jgi:hypothetical protein
VIGVSARSYVAAGLATAVAGAMVASPMLAQRQVQLPSVSSASVELSAFVSDAERAAEHAMSDAAVGVRAVRNVVAQAAGSAPQATATAAAGLKSNPLMKAAAVTVVAKAVHSVAAASSNHATNAAAVQRNAATSPAAAAALPGLPDLSRILAVPALIADIPVDIAQSEFSALDDASTGLSNVLFGLGIGDMDEVQTGFQQIADSLPNNFMHAVDFVTQDVQAIGDALGFGGFAGFGNVPANDLSPAVAAKRQGALAVTDKPIQKPDAVDAPKDGTTTKAADTPTKAGDTSKADASTKADSTTKADDSTKADSTTKADDSTKADSTTKADDSTKADDTTKADSTTKTDDAKGGTQSTSDSSTSTAHQNAPSSVNGSVKNSGATKTENAGHTGAASGTSSRGGGSAASGATGSATKRASAGDSGPKHAAAKRGGAGAGASKGSKGSKGGSK